MSKTNKDIQDECTAISKEIEALRQVQEVLSVAAEGSALLVLSDQMDGTLIRLERRVENVRGTL